MIKKKNEIFIRFIVGAKINTKTMTRFFNFGFKSSLVGLYAAVSTFLCGSSVLAANDKRHKLKRIGVFRNWFSILFFNPILIVSISSESAPLITLVYGLFSACMCLKYKSRVFKNIPLLLCIFYNLFFEKLLGVEFSHFQVC